MAYRSWATIPRRGAPGTMRNRFYSRYRTYRTVNQRYGKYANKIAMAWAARKRTIRYNLIRKNPMGAVQRYSKYGKYWRRNRPPGVLRRA